MVYLVYILADPARGHGPVLVKVCVEEKDVYERLLEVYYQYALDDYNEWLSQPEGSREMGVDGDSLD